MQKTHTKRTKRDEKREETESVRNHANARCQKTTISEVGKNYSPNNASMLKTHREHIRMQKTHTKRTKRDEKREKTESATNHKNARFQKTIISQVGNHYSQNNTNVLKTHTKRAKTLPKVTKSAPNPTARYHRVWA